MSVEPSRHMPKRALIVDDSRSARVILGRMLEGYGLLVDSSESAEQGLEYLRHHRPDVIFMDHLMPGMDGFQAVQAIKGNPQTATIPVVMYTSQEGELYLSQARALGAVGVLPKTIKQADVSKVLYQLRLLPDRRESRGAANDDVAPSVEIEAPRRPSVGELETAIRSAVAPLLHEHASELRRFVLASLESFARRLASEHKHAAPSNDVTIIEPAEPKPPVRSSARSSLLLAAIAALAVLSTLVLGVLYAQSVKVRRAALQANAKLSVIVQEQQAQIGVLRSDADRRSALATVAAVQPSAGSIRPELVPYGEVPLAGARLERLRALITDLRERGFVGKIKVATYSGEFCLTGNGFEGYSLAADDLPFNRCDVVGNPFDDGMSAAQRQSLAFANLLSSMRSDSHDSLVIEIQHLGRQPAVPYPDANQDKLTAGDWNKVAVLNNRVEFTAESSEHVEK